LQTGSTEIIHTVTFNADGSCVSLATNKGFKIFTTDPLKLRQHRDLGAPLQFVEMLGRSNLLALVGFEHSLFVSNRVALFDDGISASTQNATTSSAIAPSSRTSSPSNLESNTWWSL
jgi:hypothetical protein